MRAYLRGSEKFKDANETTGIFVRRVRDLAFRIEDVVDEFTYRLEDCNHGGLATRIKKWIKHAMIWRHLALKLRNINAELEDAGKNKELYVTPQVLERSANQTLSFAREEDLVGIEDDVIKLTQWIIGDLEIRSRKIVTVWGMGGVGKTTLVEHVFKIVKADFDTAAWVTVSKSYQVEDLLIKIAREFGVSVDAWNMEMRSLVDAIRFCLEGKRYILILDDVWEKDVWVNIMDVFPSNSTSRIILTSRKHEVASLATSDCAIKLEPLGEDHSWNLFRKLAFRNNDDKRMPSELEYLAVKFLQKCEGLPIAIACIGRLLSCKPTSYSAWKNVYEDLELQSTKNVIPGVDVILKVSLEDLPFELKNCFLHCAIFPEDYEMKRRRLIRHWITAGFIEEKENQTMEEVAERCLNELVNRSLLQVVKKNGFGRVKCCRMHDAVRQLALDRAEKECFGKVYEGSRTFSVDGTRRLSIQSSNIGPLSQSGPANFRAILVFTNYIDIDLLRPILASSNLLSTLDLQGTQLKMLPDEVFSLFNLRFLGLRNTGSEILPEAVGRLQNLVVLDALGTCLLYLPKNVAKLKKLRFLYACAVLIEGNIRRYDGVKVPRGIGNLTRLRALQNVKASIETLCDVAALTELRTFAVCDLKSEHSSNLCSAILNMSHLVHLSIAALNENELLPMEALRLPNTLSVLELEGQLEKNRMPQILSSWSHLHSLTRLSLISSKLDEDSFASFAVLRNLCFLELSKAYDGKKLNFCAALSFPRLRQLRVCDAPQLNQVKIEEGALENLVELVFSDCPELNSLPDGIEHLTTLEELCLLDTADELIEELRQECRGNRCNEELIKISHIRKVLVRLTERNIWEIIH